MFHSCLIGVQTSQIKPETQKTYLLLFLFFFLIWILGVGGTKQEKREHESVVFLSLSPASIINRTFTDKTTTF